MRLFFTHTDKQTFMGPYHKKNETFLVVRNKYNASRYLAEVQAIKQGFKTIIACNAKEALQIVSEYPEIDMLLIDLMLDNNY